MRAKYKLMQSSHHLLCSACRLNFKHLSGSRAAFLCVHIVFEPSDVTYPGAAVSPLWPPSLRLLGGSCQSFWTSPRQPCLRHSPCSPWLRTHDQASTDEQGGERRRSSALMRSGCATNGRVVPVSTEAQTQP